MIYRKESNRLPERDYTNEGGYFVTICVKDFKCLFGDVLEGEMILNDLGKIVYEEIINTNRIRKNVDIDQFVIMPNHLHMIVFINDTSRDDSYNDFVETRRGVSDDLNTRRNCSYNDSVETRRGVCNDLNRFAKGKSLRSGNKFGGLNKNSLGSIINLMKGQITKRCKLINPLFSRQSNYYEHVIRNDKDLERIQKYILNNPFKWRNDEYYKSYNFKL